MQSCQRNVIVALALWGVVFVGQGTAAQPTLELPSVIADHMVLQRQTAAAVWGWDAPAGDVAVTFRGQTVKTKAEASGKWLLRVNTGEAGGPFDLSIEGSRKVELRDVMVGEVWVAGGQSNMWWHVGNCKNLAKEKAEAKLPGIRIWDPTNTSDRQAGWPATEPQRTVKAQWVVAAPETVADFPGTAYFFAKQLHQRLGVPVGIVHLAVPGTDIEMHLSPKFVSTNLPQTIDLREQRKKTYAADRRQYEEARGRWEEAKKAAQAGGKPVPPEPAAPVDPKAPYVGAFFNGMVMPVAPLSIRGFLWWQGENNAGRWLQYRVLFPGLIQEWRETWNVPDAPFLYVELHGWLPRQTRPVEQAEWPNLRDAQRAALRLPNTYAVSAIDILDPDEGIFQIHPGNKQLAGRRLCQTAMANVYSEKGLEWSGPVYRAAEFGKGEVVVRFDHAQGLKARDGKELKGFAVAGADRRFVWAEARIEGDTVRLTSNVARPVAVRYGWANYPIGNLYNVADLPAFPFRSDQWNLELDPR